MRQLTDFCQILRVLQFFSSSYFSLTCLWSKFLTPAFQTIAFLNKCHEKALKLFLAFSKYLRPTQHIRPLSGANSRPGLYVCATASRSLAWIRSEFGALRIHQAPPTASIILINCLLGMRCERVWRLTFVPSPPLASVPPSLPRSLARSAAILQVLLSLAIH
jgi:hypothetical protein